MSRVLNECGRASSAGGLGYGATPRRVAPNPSDEERGEVSESMTASRRPGGAPARFGRRLRVYDAVVLALALAAIVPIARLVELPSFDDRITVTNPPPP